MRFAFGIAASLAVLAAVACNEQQPADVAQAPERNTETVPPPPAPAPADPSITDDAEAADDSPGIAVGEKAPEFQLKDQSGTEQSLNGLLAGGPVALVFYRSADW